MPAACVDECSLPKYFFKTADDSKLEARRVQLVDFWDNLSHWVGPASSRLMSSQPMRDLLQ
eukprot:COSAG01_NODE_39456_length_476_cov_0.915119_1_plen_60_part_10